MSKLSHLQRTLLFSLTAALLIMLAACNSGQAGTGQVTPTAAPANLESTTQPTPSNTAQPTEPGKPGPAETGTPFAGKTVIPLPEGPLTVAYVKDDNLWI